MLKHISHTFRFFKTGSARRISYIFRVVFVPFEHTSVEDLQRFRASKRLSATLLSIFLPSGCLSTLTAATYCGVEPAVWAPSVYSPISRHLKKKKKEPALLSERWESAPSHAPILLFFIYIYKVFLGRMIWGCPLYGCSVHAMRVSSDWLSGSCMQPIKCG